MGSVKIINFKSHKQYSFSTSINSHQFRIHVRYNSYTDSYYFNIDNLVDGKYENIINSVSLVTGVDLFMQHPQLELGVCYIIPMKLELEDKNPTAETLVNNYILLWVEDL